MSDFNDLDTEDLLGDKKSKRIKSGRKGKAQERDLCHLLNKRFETLLSKNPSGGNFQRTVGSGNRWAQGVILSEQAKQVYASDICCPEKFKFVIESKKGYNDIDLCTAFIGKCPGLDAFLKQVEEDAVKVSKLPLLVWKKDRRPAVAFLKVAIPDINPRLYYGPWMGVSFEALLEFTDDSFWFLA